VQKPQDNKKSANLILQTFFWSAFLRQSCPPPSPISQNYFPIIHFLKRDNRFLGGEICAKNTQKSFIFKELDNYWQRAQYLGSCAIANINLFTCKNAQKCTLKNNWQNYFLKSKMPCKITQQTFSFIHIIIKQT
jgi:hypothetical protein